MLPPDTSRALATVQPAPSSALVVAVQDARDYAAAARSERTRRAYRAAWEAFGAWCAEVGLVALPALPGTVATYLGHRAREGAAVASLGQYLAAITEAHRAAGHDAAALRSSAEVRAVMAGVRRVHGSKQRQARPATIEVIRAMVEPLGSSLLEVRDRAFLLLGFGAALRRSELASLDVEDLVFSPRGVEVRIARSKTDQEGRGDVVAVPFGMAPETCAVRAVKAWLSASGVASGPLFRTLRAGGRGGRIDGRDVSRVIKRAAERAGLDPSGFSGHSLRAGLATSAALAGRSDRSIMGQTRHRSRAMVDRYVRTADRWRDNAAAGLL